MRRLYNTAVRTWLLVLLAACHDDGDPPVMDRDDDGVEDQRDKCPSIPNPDQSDADGDDIGDACDECPLDGHDEDHDQSQDSCDLCPASESHDEDLDSDGVGDECDPFTMGNNAMPSRRLFFDSFLLFYRPEWQPKTVAWHGGGDFVVPTAPLGADDGLIYTALQLPATAHVEIGVDIGPTLEAGEQFGIRLVDTTGVEQGICFVSCADRNMCQIHTGVGAATADRVAFGSIHLYLRLLIDATTQKTTCFLDSENPATQVMAVPPAGTRVMLIGSPTARIGYVDVVGHGQ
jgi:hypothetical protein